VPLVPQYQATCGGQLRTGVGYVFNPPAPRGCLVNVSLSSGAILITRGGGHAQGTRSILNETNIIVMQPLDENCLCAGILRAVQYLLSVLGMYVQSK
jgi:hypothetical protein